MVSVALRRTARFCDNDIPVVVCGVHLETSARHGLNNHLQAVSRRRDDAELAGQNLVENLRALSQAGRKSIFFQDLLGSCRLANLGKGQSDKSEEHTSELQSLMRISY